MIGLDKFTEARKSGVLLSRAVLIWHGVNPLRPKKFKEEISSVEAVAESARDDFRPLVGLDVTLCTPTLTAECVAIYERIKQYAKSVIFVALDRNDGKVWLKESGLERRL